jgi:hypothetical protein
MRVSENILFLRIFDDGDDNMDERFMDINNNAGDYEF